MISLFHEYTEISQNVWSCKFGLNPGHPLVNVSEPWPQHTGFLCETFFPHQSKVSSDVSLASRCPAPSARHAGSSPLLPSFPPPPLRCGAGGVRAAGAAGSVGEDGSEGAKPPPARAVLLRCRPGGPLVSAQRQPRTRARTPEAAAGPEGRPAAGLCVHIARKHQRQHPGCINPVSRGSGSDQHPSTWVGLSTDKLLWQKALPAVIPLNVWVTNIKKKLFMGILSYVPFFLWEVT